MLNGAIKHLWLTVKGFYFGVRESRSWGRVKMNYRDDKAKMHQRGNRVLKSVYYSSLSNNARFKQSCINLWISVCVRVCCQSSCRRWSPRWTAPKGCASTWSRTPGTFPAAFRPWRKPSPNTWRVSLCLICTLFTAKGLCTYNISYLKTPGLDGNVL